MIFVGLFCGGMGGGGIGFDEMGVGGGVEGGSGELRIPAAQPALNFSVTSA